MLKQNEIKEQRYSILNFLYNFFFEENTGYINIDEIVKLYPEKPKTIFANLDYLRIYGYVKGKKDEEKDGFYSWVKITKEGIDYIESLDKKQEKEKPKS